ncbi:hypothetical protein MJO29_016339, partial [Puccinia striiformis f. sp. tritici]
ADRNQTVTIINRKESNLRTIASDGSQNRSQGIAFKNDQRHISPAAKKQDRIPSETTAKPVFGAMELELEDEIQRQEEETVAIVAVALLLTTLTHFGTQGIPYNDLPLTGTTTSSLMKVWPWQNNIGPPIPKIPPPPPEPEYSSERKRQHCKNWRDSITEGLWTQYIDTLQDRRFDSLVIDKKFKETENGNEKGPRREKRERLRVT